MSCQLLTSPGNLFTPSGIVFPRGILYSVSTFEFGHSYWANNKRGPVFTSNSLDHIWADIQPIWPTNIVTRPIRPIIYHLPVSDELASPFPPPTAEEEISSRLLRRRRRYASLPILRRRRRRLAVPLRLRLRPEPVLVGVRLAGAVPHPRALLRPARALLRSPAAYAALSGALRAGGGADDPACHWLYDTLLSRDADLRLAALAFLPLLAALYLRRLPPELPSSLSGFEAVLLAVYSSEAKNRQGKPVLVQVPDLSVPSLYHAPASTPSSKSPRRHQPPPIPPPQATPVVGVLSPLLEPQAAVKSTKRAGIIGVAFEAYYKISQMPAASKVDACNAAAAWTGQYCKCRFELDEKELEEEEGDSLGSVSPMLSEAENGKELEEELSRMRINGDSSGRNCHEDYDKEARLPLPWELLQPVMRVLGHCLLAPLNPVEVRDAAADPVRVVYARACHDLCHRQS
ncbi:hypothetical protein SEVIR_8G049366v4 [Setaria viridis]